MAGEQRRHKQKKDGQLVIRINSKERDDFIDLCEQLDSSAAREIRRFIREFIAQQAPPGPTD
ncbi:hypothetical protein C7H85_17220 [Zobellella endophytica]|uniref:Uncharacterized protein n=1 Tax=Zobellella endophytica TaxID=2116700 RepID=A0A2P7QWL8_9GAMM|nr:hypothetical protein [Zobellella endophytica]PSJ42351.1 hypothetical protein C7H85_17220 [Zobellella endophytica]